MDLPSEPEPAAEPIRFVTVRDLQELLRRVGQQRIYRPAEEGSEDYASYAERYLSAVRRFREVSEKKPDDDK